MPDTAATTGKTAFASSPVNVRIKLSGLWTAMLFIFAYVDLFSLYRADVRADIEAGVLAGFTIGQSFLLGTTIFIALPSLMVFASLVLRPRLNRIANIVLGGMYALATIVGAIGEWNYYLLGSALEVALLGGIVYYAVTWPKGDPAIASGEREEAPQRTRVGAL